MEGRGSENAYATFFVRFVSVVVGKLIMRRRIQICTGNRHIASISDEAFALLIIENNEAKWLDVHERTKGHQLDKANRKGESWSSDVPTRYTQQGLSYEEKKFRAGDRGWSIAGIERFNELFDFVDADRKKNPSFLRNCVQSWRDASPGKKPKPAPASEKKIVKARNEFGREDYDATDVADDDDDEPEEEEQEENGEEED